MKMLKKMFKKMFNVIFGVFPINNKKIMFECGRNRVDDNPLAVYRYIKSNCKNEFKTKFLVKKGTDISSLEKKDVCYYRTLTGMYHLATSKYWIRSQSMGGILEKRKNQIYIQMWHGAGAIKKMGNDITGNKTILDHAKSWDYLIATDELNKKVMCSSTGFDEYKTIVLGSSTTDFLVNYTESDVNRIKEKIEIEKTKKKVILYAPTFRDDELGKEVNLNIISLGKLKNYIFLVRLHPLMNSMIKDLNLPNNFINVCDYPDIHDLLIISDALITDYSGVYFSYSVLKRPIIFYPYDYEKYLKDRGFYYDYKTFVPGPIVYNESQLYKLLSDSNNVFNENVVKRITDFSLKYNKLDDGKVCERFVKLLKEGYFIDNLKSIK